MSDNSIEKISITEIDISSSRVEEKKDYIAKEAPLHLYLNSSHLITIPTSPTQVKELVIGHLIAEGIINSTSEIVKLSFEKNRSDITLQDTDAIRKNIETYGETVDEILPELLDKMKRFADWHVKASEIYTNVNRLNTLAETFKQTGGVHVAALFHSDNQLVILAEDVGRHNAVDKVFGGATLKGEDLESCYLAFSGRITSRIVLKAARVGIPIIASLGAATDSGLRIAEKAGITLIGFIRKNRMNVYTCRERIEVQ
jgi:FdhD protein